MAERKENWSTVILFLTKLCLWYDTKDVGSFTLDVPPHVDGREGACSSQSLLTMCQAVLEGNLELCSGDTLGSTKQEWDETWAVLKCLQHVR